MQVTTKKDQKIERTEANYYNLTKQEYDDLSDAVWQIDSTVRMVAEKCFREADGVSSKDNALIDASNCLDLLECKLSRLKKIIGK